MVARFDPHYQKVNPVEKQEGRELVTFHSRSEYACARTLEAFTPWRLSVGVNFQVPVGRCRFDFRIGDTFVEYHPVNFRYDMITDCYHDVLGLLDKIGKDRREGFIETLSKELFAQYCKRRSQILQASDLYRDCKLIVVADPVGFIKDVVSPRCNFADPPSKAEMLARWHWHIKND